MPPKQTRKVPKFCHPIFSGQEKGIKKRKRERKSNHKSVALLDNRNIVQAAMRWRHKSFCVAKHLVTCACKQLNLLLKVLKRRNSRQGMWLLAQKKICGATCFVSLAHEPSISRQFSNCSCGTTSSASGARNHGKTLCMNDVPFLRGPHCPLNINTFSNILHQRYCKNLIWNQGGPETTEEVLCAPLVNDIHIYIYIYIHNIYLIITLFPPKKT